MSGWVVSECTWFLPSSSLPDSINTLAHSQSDVRQALTRSLPDSCVYVIATGGVL